MSNLFENLQLMHEIAKRQETVDEYFDTLTDKIATDFGCTIDDTYYDVDNWPEEFKASFIVFNIDDQHMEEEVIKDVIKNYCGDRFNNINVSGDYLIINEKYTDEFITKNNIENAYEFKIETYN